MSGGTRLPPQTVGHLPRCWCPGCFSVRLVFQPPGPTKCGRGNCHSVHSLVTYSPLYSWSVFELLTITATWILPATCFWNTSSMFSAKSSLTRSKYQMPVTRASKRKLPARGTGTGCFPVGGPLPRFASRTASWAAMPTSHSCPYFVCPMSYTAQPTCRAWRICNPVP